MKSYAQPDSRLAKLLEQMKKELAAEAENDPTAGITKQIEACHQELERLVLAMGGTEPGGAFAQKLAGRAAELKAELSRLEDTLTKAKTGRGEETERRLDPDAFCTALLAFSDGESQINVHEKRALIRLLVQKCEWDGEKLHIFICGEQ